MIHPPSNISSSDPRNRYQHQAAALAIYLDPPPILAIFYNFVKGNVTSRCVLFLQVPIIDSSDYHRLLKHYHHLCFVEGNWSKFQLLMFILQLDDGKQRQAME